VRIDSTDLGAEAVVEKMMEVICSTRGEN
jgi:hypothetical protein